MFNERREPSSGGVAARGACAARQHCRPWRNQFLNSERMGAPVQLTGRGRSALGNGSGRFAGALNAEQVSSQFLTRGKLRPASGKQSQLFP